jgi:hypothetical protein
MYENLSKKIYNLKKYKKEREEEKGYLVKILLKLCLFWLLYKG